MPTDASNPFERLHADVQHHIANSLGWKELRDVQKQAIEPILAGENAVLLAPTAGGKTEAAFFPLMSRLLEERWEGLSLLYLSPIRALLNNQFDRLEKLFGLIGYRVGVWHGDVAQSAKRRIRENPPHVLLTTPESLEGMLISTKTSGPGMFGDLHAVVIDEVHAFADDDRGWHLLGVLSRLSRHAGRDLQRIGLSATVGNPPEIAEWISRGSERRPTTIDPPAEDQLEPEVELDWVGTVRNAAKIVDQLFKGERRLVFCDSRLQAEKMARELRNRRVDTYLNHSSLSREERRRTERKFAEGGPGAIVATSALELGIDIGDLDRVVQLDAPYSVASFLQRMGRTGRRKGQRSNMLYLATTEQGLVRGASLIDLWLRDFVEDARPPREPLQILAQQMLAQVLEDPGLSKRQLLGRVDAFCRAGDLSADDARELYDFLHRHDYLFTDGPRVGIGRSGEAEFGQKHFLELVSVFTSPPIFTVKAQNKEIGTVHQTTFSNHSKDERSIILLAGKSWLVTDLDWDRRIAYVEEFDMPGKTTWLSGGLAMGKRLAEAHRDILTGSNRGLDYWSDRATDKLDHIRNAFTFLDSDAPTIQQGSDAWTLWTFAGGRANDFLADRLLELGVESASASALRVVVDEGLPRKQLEAHLRDALRAWPDVPREHPMLENLKFSELLPNPLLQRAARARLYADAHEDLPDLRYAVWQVSD